MGYYVEVPVNKGKAAAIVAGKAMVQLTGEPGNSMDRFNPKTEWGYSKPYAAEIVARPPLWGDIPEDKALVVVVDNGLFEAAGLAYDEREYGAFTHPDHRPRTYVLMDKDAAYRSAGYTPRVTTEGK